MGALPPLSDGEWIDAFKKYQAIPEYQLVNSHMGLADFKRIFFWEWLHRNWGRLMGLVFIVPFLVFWRRGLLKGWPLRRMLWIILGGGIVGSLGWFMVLSGLGDQRDANGQLLVDVSHYRLAIHLCAAFAVFGLVQWTAMDLQAGRRSFVRAQGPAGSWGRALLVLLAVQIVWGAFTAGLGAGFVHNTWPLMSGSFVPDTVPAQGGVWTAFTAHDDGVQFVHRNLAWLVAAAFIAFAVRYRQVAGVPWQALIGLVLLQFALGVAALLTHVHIVPGVMHQVGALALLSVLLAALHRTGR
jgi:cytochrome c oxidase assembly protein subunit 15